MIRLACSSLIFLFLTGAKADDLCGIKITHIKHVITDNQITQLAHHTITDLDQTRFAWDRAMAECDDCKMITKAHKDFLKLEQGTYFCIENVRLGIQDDKDPIYGYTLDSYVYVPKAGQ